MLKTLTKVSGREISTNVLKGAEAEKNLQDKFNKIDLQDLSIGLGINKALDLVKEFNNIKGKKPNYSTLLRLYLLQNYTIDMNYYKGSGMTFISLKQMKSLVKKITKTGHAWDGVDPTCKSVSTYDKVTAFIIKVKEVVKPIRLYETNNRGSISSAIEYMSPVEKSFVTSSINSEIKLPQTKLLATVKKDDKMNKRKPIDIKLFIKNTNKSLKELCDMFPTLSPKTVSNYKTWYTKLNNGITKSIPQTIINTYNRNKLGSTSTKQIIQEVKQEIERQINTSNPIEQNKLYGLFNSKTNEVSNITNSVDFVKGFKACLDSSTELHTPFKVVEFKFI